MQLDWNPNIITGEFNWEQLKRHAEGQSYRKNVNAPGLLEKGHLLMEKYAEAKKLAGKRAVLAFKLNLFESKVPTGSHLGGIPDLFNLANDAAENAAYNFKEKRLAKLPTLHEIIERLWPKSHDGTPLLFLGTFELFDWMQVIHQLTGKPWKDSSREFSCSAGGNHRMFEYPHRQHVWFDPDFGCPYLASNAAVFIEHEPLNKTETYSRQQVAETATQIKEQAGKVKRACGYEVPNIFLGEPKLGFDIESTPADKLTVSDSVHDRLWEHPLFASEGVITAFGKPSSQQTEQRYINPYPFHPHRMTPFLSWHNEEHDITYQLYASFKTFSFRVQWVEAKIDSSCT